MLDFIRKNKRIAQVLLLIFVVPSFVFVGMEGYSRMGDKENVVAKVAERSITQDEWDAALRNQANRLRKMMGSRVNEKIFDTAEFKDDVLDGVIVRYALGEEVAKNYMSVSDYLLQQNIVQTPGLMKADGTFDNARYKSLLAAQGMTSASYEAGLRYDLTIKQIRSAVQSSAFSPETVVSHISDLAAQERTVQPMMFHFKKYLNKVNVTDDMLQNYYKKNAAFFEVPESMDIEYLVLSMDSVAPGVTVSDADAESFYKQNERRYATQEKRRASHILISVAKDALEDEKSNAKKQAQTVLQEVLKNPDQFAALAKKHSSDPGSAQLGGDLNYFVRGAMVPEFDQMAFKLKKGQISNLVQTEFGYHIIQLTDIQASTIKPFAEMKEQIVADITTQLISKKFSEVAELFTNMVYEQPDSLAPVAKELGLKIQKLSGLKRGSTEKGTAQAPYKDSKFVAAMYSDDVLKNKHNSEALEVAKNVLISGRVVKHSPTKTRAFETVKNIIKERVTQQEATALAVEAGKDKLVKLQKGEQVSGFGSSKVISRNTRQALPPQLLVEIMKANVTKLPAYVGMSYPMQGYGIYRITKVETPTTGQASRQAHQRELVKIMAQQEMMAYLNALKIKAKTELIKTAAKKNQEEN